MDKMIKETSVKTLSYYLFVALTLLLSVFCLFYQLNIAFNKPEEPIRPTNQISSTSPTATSNSSSLSATEKSTAVSTTRSSTKEASTSSSSKKEAKPLTLSPLNLILTATLDKEEKGDDVIKTYIVKEPIDKSDFQVTIKQVTLAKLTEDSMKSTGYDGEGILDIELDLNNKTKDKVTVYPDQIKLEVNGEEAPVSLSKSFKETTLKPKEKLTDSFLTTFPKLKKVEDIQEFSFTWVTEINKITQPYNITLLLTEK